MGELATFLGAVIIGLSAWILGLDHLRIYGLSAAMLVSVVAGSVGCTIDSIIGATIQGMFKCRVCGSTTENKKHCGSPTSHLRGFNPIDNNTVNFIATAAGALIGVAIFELL